MIDLIKDLERFMIKLRQNRVGLNQLLPPDDVQKTDFLGKIEIRLCSFKVNVANQNC